MKNKGVAMSQLILQPTTLAQWYTLVNDAECSCSLQLDQEVESYLVYLLMRFSDKPEMAKSILAIEFLESLHLTGSYQSNVLREVGDKCLLYAGLFPERAERRRVKESYFIDLGQNAYYLLATLSESEIARLYNSICKAFLAMRNILLEMRKESHIKVDDFSIYFNLKK